jgi:hypothetical protein
MYKIVREMVNEFGTWRWTTGILTCEICSGTFIDHTIDPEIGFDVIWYVSPFSANLVSKWPGERSRSFKRKHP